MLYETINTFGENALQVTLAWAAAGIGCHHARDWGIGAKEGTEFSSRLELSGKDGLEHGEEQVFLFFGPLLSSRLFNTAKDGLAKRYKVRIVNPERPGIGKTDSVPAEKLLEVWRGEYTDSDVLLGTSLSRKTHG